ncbi:hypothetical protein NHX12_022194 [Muraenolepis orangiensis]|uniref:Uncharacterized protein n=1 Tax=Muraenolepis orangiensis TaxID=630683 RepID=A0A9Q0ER44_9TELE|nr:hypothetical protein NHX12_022194 [Muraenolepis orangiensis]
MRAMPAVTGVRPGSLTPMNLGEEMRSRAPQVSRSAQTRLGSTVTGIETESSVRQGWGGGGGGGGGTVTGGRTDGVICPMGAGGTVTDIQTESSVRLERVGLGLWGGGGWKTT